MEFVRLENINKDFSGVKALSGVSLHANCGEILALLGENGAGKSTLMNILSGTYAAGSYDGQIFIRGSRVEFGSPRDAEHAGITIIHQELSSFHQLSVTENLWVGHWPTRRGLVDWQAMFDNAQIWLTRVGASFHPQEKMGSLSTGNQQLVEIAKALSRNSQLLILDEPTSSLTPQETDRLFELLRLLKRDGRALIYISHKMDEIFALADRVTVLRDGRSVHSAEIGQLDEPSLIAHMVGRSLDRLYPERPVRSENFQYESPILVVKDLTMRVIETGRDIGPISFNVGRGEIIGIAGLLGSGRSEIVQSIMGGWSGAEHLRGSVSHLGKDLSFCGPRAALKSHLAMVGEDRKRDSIFSVRSLNENTGISRLAIGALSKILNPVFESQMTRDSLTKFRTRYRDEKQRIQDLSGGNQQKIVIARALQLSPDVIILDEPTRGVDVGAKFEIYQILIDLAAAGKALIVVSSDLSELLALADRILVVAEGMIVGDLPRDRFSQKEIMRLAVKSRQVN